MASFVGSLVCSVEKHGEMAIETVDALEAYGNALLKNGIASSAVLGGEAAKEKAALPSGMIIYSYTM